MAERAGRKAARDLMNRAGYGSRGGHLGRADGGSSDDAEDKAFVRSGVRQHETGMHKGETPTRLKLQDGGSSSGMMSSRRGDRSSRKGSGKSDGHQPKVNILIHSGGNQQPGAGGGMPSAPPPMPPHPPVPNMPPPPPPMARGPGGMPMGPSGMPMPVPVPMGSQPGGPLPPGGIGGLPPRPPGMASGGRARRQMGGGTSMPMGAAVPPPMAGGQPMMIPGAAGGAPAGPLPRPLGMKGGGRAGCADGGGMGSGTHKMTFGSGSGAGRLQKIGKQVPSY